MNSEQNIDFSLLISMLIHMLSVATGVVLFTKPFVKRKIAAFMSGVSYIAVMTVMYLVPAEFDNIIDACTDGNTDVLRFFYCETVNCE